MTLAERKAYNKLIRRKNNGRPSSEIFPKMKRKDGKVGVVIEPKDEAEIYARGVHLNISGAVKRER